MFNKQQGKCPYTGVELTIGVNAELDHKISRKLGGKDTLDNLQWVLSIVNTMKWCHLEKDFLNAVRLIYEHKLQEKNYER